MLIFYIQVGLRSVGKIKVLMSMSSFSSIPIGFSVGYACDQIFLRCNTDIESRQDLDKFNKDRINALDKIDISFLGKRIFEKCVYSPINEEVTYRLFLERAILPQFFPCFTQFSISRTFISNVPFAVNHLFYTGLKANKYLVIRFFYSFFIGSICSIAQQHIGLIGAIFLHAGNNISNSMTEYSLSFLEVSKRLSSLKIKYFFDELAFSIGWNY